MSLKDELSYPGNILYEVIKPARYTGGEWNSVFKGWESTPLRIALAYPDLYEVGMSNMALPILYELLNSQPDVLAERAFAPWVDMQSVMRAKGIPLLSLESKHPLKDFDVVGFSLGYELTYTNVLSMLHLAGIPLLAAERDDSHPIVIAGGTCALNPEPMSDFIDFFVIGDGEETLMELLDCFRAWKSRNKRASRKQLLRQAAAIPGVYVPAFYDVEYRPDGIIKSITPNVPEAKPRVLRRIVSKLPPPVTKPVVPYIEVIHDRGAVEISRGCSRGCRFCHAGVVYRPVRERPHEEVMQAVGEVISNCGYDEVSLVSLSTTDYSHIDGLVARLAERYRDQNLAISLPSLRIDSSSVRLIDALATRRRTGLTFAPEAGSKRLQQVINKVTPEDMLMDTAATAFDSGWATLKLYFMIGLPTETREDAEAIPELVTKVYTMGRKAPGKRPQIRVSLGTYVPKPHTPFQWVAQEKETELDAKQAIVRNGLSRKGIKLSWQDPKVSLLEAVLSRGDRRLGKVIHRAWQLGAAFDAWGEHFKFENWLKAFEETGVDPAFYAHRQRALDEPLPWGHIDTGLTATFLKREYKYALEGIETPDCRFKCTGCGLQRRQSVCRERYGKAKQAPPEKSL